MSIGVDLALAGIVVVGGAVAIGKLGDALGKKTETTADTGKPGTAYTPPKVLGQPVQPGPQSPLNPFNQPPAVTTPGQPATGWYNRPDGNGTMQCIDGNCSDCFGPGCGGFMDTGCVVGDDGVVRCTGCANAWCVPGDNGVVGLTVGGTF